MSSYMLTIFYSSRRRCVSCSVLLMLVSVKLCGLIWLLIQKKSCCIRIGPRNDRICANVTTSQGYRLPWTNEIRYLGTYIAKSRQFRCSIDHAKKSFFRSANSIFGKIGRTVSEKVTLELLKTKCIPVLIYGLECFSLAKSDLKSLDFAVTRFLMKLFRMSNTKIIAEF